MLISVSARGALRAAQQECSHILSPCHEQSIAWFGVGHDAGFAVHSLATRAPAAAQGPRQGLSVKPLINQLGLGWSSFFFFVSVLFPPQITALACSYDLHGLETDRSHSSVRVGRLWLYTGGTFSQTSHIFKVRARCLKLILHLEQVLVIRIAF